MTNIEILKARTGDKWLKAVELAKAGKSTGDIVKESGVSRTYAWEAKQLAKAEVEAITKPLPSEVEVQEARVEKPPEAIEKPPTKPPERPTEEGAKEEVELEIIPDEEDCKDLYAIPFETIALIFNDEALEVSEARIEKQGKRLHKLFQKYKWKLPLLEVLFGAGFASDIGTKIMYLWEKRKKEKEKGEAGKTSKEGSSGKSERNDRASYEAKRKRES